jgi:hypothetical protein
MSNPVTPEEVAKLPRRWREFIEAKERRAEAAEAQVAQLFSDVPTRVIVEPTAFANQKTLYLPDRTTVRFVLENKDHIDVSLRELYVLGDGRANALDIRGSWALQILPSASNSIYIKPARS